MGFTFTGCSVQVTRKTHPCVAVLPCLAASATDRCVHKKYEQLSLHLVWPLIWIFADIIAFNLPILLVLVIIFSVCVVRSVGC